MGFLTLNEDRPTPKNVYNWRVYMLASVASFAAVTIGYDSAFIGTTLALPSFVSEFSFATYSATDLALLKSNIVSVYQAGAFFGSIFAYPTAYYFGRRLPLLVYSVVFIVGAGMMLGANSERGLGLIIGGRVLAGIGVGAMSMITPIYIAEISPPAIRGRIVGLYELGWQVGGLVGFWINYGLLNTMAPSRKQWLIPFAVQLIPAGILLVGTFAMRESPRWLISKNRREEALKSLCWIRNLPADHIYLVEEVGMMDAALEQQSAAIGSGFWKPFQAVKRSRSIQWRFILGGSLFLWQNGSGINAINYYSPTVFRALGVVGTNAGFLSTGLFGVVKTVLTFIWLLFLIDQFGRRKMLLVGAAGGAVCMFIIGGLVISTDTSAAAIARASTAGLSPTGIAAMFFIFAWTSFYTIAWNGTPWVVNSEIFDMNTRALAMAFSACNNWLWNFVISRATPTMFLRMGKSGGGVFFFFASMMVLSVVYIFFLLPETKSIPLEAMDRLFAAPVRHANKMILAEEQARDAEFRQNADGADLSVEKEKTQMVESVSERNSLA